MLLETEDLSWDAVDYLADKELTALRNKWVLYRGLIDTPCNLVALNGTRFLFLSSSALDENEHEVLISSLDWGLKTSYPIDKIELAIKQYFFDNFYKGERYANSTTC